MHDLEHDLARDILKSELFDLRGVGGENLSQVRYFGWDSPSDQIDKINDSGIQELSDKIGKLIHLRYLDLSDTKITTFPHSICEIYNLQTHRFYKFGSLLALPYEMGNMISLQHIYFCSRSQTPLNMGQLTCFRPYNISMWV
uniref:Disease resistance R13L4/SHOC-2-like LRR domain-containing protein n=1 Tax=Solanum lycopersicum TaxID=4081 RepID=K4D156_SOLLC